MWLFGRVWIKKKQEHLRNHFLEDIIETFYLYPQLIEKHMKDTTLNKELNL